MVLIKRDIVSNYQITIPRDIRKKYNIELKDTVIVKLMSIIKNDGKVIAVPEDGNDSNKKQTKLNKLKIKQI